MKKTWNYSYNFVGGIKILCRQILSRQTMQPNLKPLMS